MVDFNAINRVNQWRAWYFDSFDHILKQIKQDVDGMGKGCFQNPQPIEPHEVARLERVIGALHLCCKAMPAVDEPSECGMGNEVALLVEMSANLHSYARASKQVYPPEEPPF